MNLTSITSYDEIAKKHFIDSLSLLPWMDENIKLLDIGAGAGFPGLPLKIVRPDIKLTLLDSTRKKVNFLRETADMLGLMDVECIHARAEELNRKPEYSGRFDACTARAVARLSKLVRYALPFLKPGGFFLAMKGQSADDEINEAKQMIDKCGGKIIETKKIEIYGRKHLVVMIKKKGDDAMT
jgi:16S rRNA (guanine527-N7)-methyltransferase